MTTRNMRTILFFDDWPILHRQGIDRRWFQTEPWPGLAPWHDPSVDTAAISSILRDPTSGRWRAWGSVSADRDKGDGGVGLGVYESDDGFDWQPLRQNPLVDKNATAGASHIVFSGEFGGGGGVVFHDEREPDPSRRYKCPYTDLSPNPVDSSYGTCRVATSPDGIHWTIDREAVWRRQHVDGMAAVLHNPYTGMYQWPSRPILGDRRVSLEQTCDWKRFERPLVIVHPDPMDMPGVEFYGMGHFFYEGYFLGFLLRMWGAPNDLAGSTRFMGRVDAELTYSVNGIAWNRTNRQSFLPDRGWGRDDFGNEYPSTMVLDDDGWLRVYTASYLGEHNDGAKFPKEETILFVTVSRWRRDGFCALESHSDTGSVLMRGLLPRGGQILLNAITGRFGRIRAELRDLQNKAIPGYELEHSAPVSGDGHFLPLYWQDGPTVRETIDPLDGRPFKLFLELEQARLYAVRVDADLLYGFVPETNLAGDYIPDRCY